MRLDRGGSALRALPVADALERVEAIPLALPWAQLVARVAEAQHEAFPAVVEAGKLAGLLVVREVRAALLDPSLERVAVAGDLGKPGPVVQVDDSLEEALASLDPAGADNASVLGVEEERTPLGILTRQAVLSAWRRAHELLEHRLRKQ